MIFHFQLHKIALIQKTYQHKHGLQQTEGDQDVGTWLMALKAVFFLIAMLIWILALADKVVPVIGLMVKVVSGSLEDCCTAGLVGGGDAVGGAGPQVE